MSKLPLYVTSTKSAAGYGLVANIMSFPSGGDIVPDLELAKKAEGGEDTGSNELTQLQPQHDAGDGPEDDRESSALDNTIEEEEGDEEEGLEDREKDSVEEENEPEPEPASLEKVDTEKQSEGNEIEVDEIQPVEEIVEEDEVEEYEYTKEEIKYMKTAFVAYQIEKPQSKQSLRKPDKKNKEVKTTEIPIGTLGSVLRSLGLNPTQLALQRYAEWLNADTKTGTVKFEELLIIVGREKKVMIDESHVLEAFRFIDVENERAITVQNLQNVLVNTCERLTQEEWIIFVHLADPKRTGLVDYENFVERMGPNPPQPEKKKKKKKGKKG